MKQLTILLSVFLFIGCGRYSKETENVAQGEHHSRDAMYAIWIWKDDFCDPKLIMLYQCPIDAPNSVKDSLNRAADSLIISLKKYDK